MRVSFLCASVHDREVQFAHTGTKHPRPRGTVPSCQSSSRHPSRRWPRSRESGRYEKTPLHAPRSTKSFLYVLQHGRPGGRSRRWGSRRRNDSPVPMLGVLRTRVDVVAKIRSYVFFRETETSQFVDRFFLPCARTEISKKVLEDKLEYSNKIFLPVLPTRST